MTTKLITVDEYRAKLKAKESVGDLGVLRIAVCEPKQVDPNNERVVRFVFSDSSVDRMGDTIASKGWVLDNYLRNAVILWAHDSSLPPIGRAHNVGVVKQQLLGDVEFMERDLSAFADTIYRMVIGKWIKACSVGFMPLDYEFSNDKDRPWGIDFKRQELLETSICPVPANANALVAAKAAGIDIAPLRGWAERLLDLGHETVLMPRSLLEDVFKAAKTPRTVRQRYLAPKTAAIVGTTRSARIAAAQSLIQQVRQTLAVSETPAERLAAAERLVRSLPT
jgi:HK97 family phage prohead protease